MAEDLFLAIDQGGHASRAIVFDDKGNALAKAEHAITTNTPHSDWVEHPADELIESVWQSIKDVCQQIGPQTKHIKAAGLATQRSSIVCWDKYNGQALSPILSWQDRRQCQWIKQFETQNETIHRKTGLFLSPHYGASKLNWCLSNIPAVTEALSNERLVIGPLASYITHNITEEHHNYIDPANAGRTLLWNIETRQWDSELCDLFSLDPKLLPDCRPSQYDFGYIHVNKHRIPLTIMTGDQPAALFAWGAPRRESCYVNIGTGAFIQRHANQHIEADKLLTSIGFQNKQTLFTLEGTVNGAARALQTLNIPNLEQVLDNWLQTSNTPPLFLNGVSGVGSPYWQAVWDSEFIPDAPLTDAEKAVAVVESIVFLIQRNIEEMEQHLSKAEQIIVSGGLSSLNGLCQKLADLSKRSVLRAKESEATAQGLAYLTAEQPEHWPSFKPEHNLAPQTNEPLTERYQQWQIAMDKKVASDRSNNP